ncbi:14543_t:CDS:2, partial [Rhizophagus irregularis]
MEVALKELNNSESINSRELNELKVYYDFVSKWKPVEKDAKKDRKFNEEYYVNLRYKPFNEDKRKRDDDLIEDTGNN